MIRNTPNEDLRGRLNLPRCVHSGVLAWTGLGAEA